MYTLRIIPIAKGLPENFFTYFHNEKVALGALVEIKIRNRKVLGIVSEQEEVLEKKVNIKSEKFILKKIERVVLNNFLQEEIFKSISNTSALLGVKESDILENYLPDFIFENLDILENENNSPEKEKILNHKSFTQNQEDRLEHYKEIINRNFKNKKSTIIFFPTINDLEFTKNNFKEFCSDEKIIYFHSGQKKKELKENLNKLKEKKEFLILSTSSLLPFLARDKINLETIILEKENSFNYFTHTNKKQIDAREVVKNLAKDLNLELICAGNILSLNTFKSYKVEIKKEKELENFKIISLAKDKIEKEEIETRTKKIKEANTKYSPVYFSDELIKKLENIKNKNGKAFLFAKRKGLYTETICADCNTIFKCEDCDKPYTLVKKENGDRMYICGSCKNKIELKKSENLTCKNCGGWRMNTLGVATQGIEENLKEVGWSTFVLDSSNIKTKKDILKILEVWQKESSASVLIGTDLALNFLNKDFICDLGAIISLDSLFGVPEITIDEKIFNISLEMCERINSKDEIIIQTRLPEQSVWEYIKESDVTGFLKNELETRKMLSLPPYSNILKWTLGKKDIKMKANIERILERIFKEENLENEKVNWRIEKKTGNYIGSMIIKKEFWEKNKTEKKDGKIIPSQFTKKITTLLSDFKLELNPPNIY